MIRCYFVKLFSKGADNQMEVFKMPKAGPINPRATFYKRAQSITKSFPHHKAKIEEFRSRISKAEALGKELSDKEMVRQLKIMATVSQRMLHDIQRAMHQAPGLQLPKEVMTRFVYVILNAKLLLSRIERLKNVVDGQMSDGAGVEELDSMFDDGDFNHLLGKKID